MKFSALRNANFVWKYLAAFLCLLAFAISYHKEAYSQAFEAGEICGWLPAGAYTLSIEYANAPEDGSFRLTANSLVSPENVQGMDLLGEKLPAGEGSLQFAVDVPAEARHVFVSSEYVTKWSVQSVKLLDYDNYFLAAVLLLLAAASLVYGAFYYREEHRAVLLLIGIGVLSSFPLFSRFFPANEDMMFHFARINGIYEGMRTGQFPVRINPVQLSGYGYITGAMYPQLFLYIPAVLKFFHVSTLLGMQLLLFGANLATPLFAYQAVRNICRHKKAAFLAAVFYTLNPYRLINFYSRGAIGEGLAMVFLPLVLWGTCEILWGERKKWYILALGMTGVLGSHLLSAELYAMLIAGEMLLWIFSRKREHMLQRFLAMGKAVAYTVLLNLYFIGSFLAFSKLKPQCYSAVVREELFTLDPVRAFEPFARWGDFYHSLGEPAFMSVTLGGVVLAGICLFLAALLKGYGQEDMAAQGKRYLVLGSLFFVLALWVVPWERMLQNKWLYHTLGAIQFPWRSFGISAMLFSVVTALAVVMWESRGRQAAGSFLCPVLLCVLLMECGSYFGDIAHSAPMSGKTEAEASNSTDNMYLCENSLPLYFYTVDFTHISCDIEEHLSWLNGQNTGPGVICGEPEMIRWTNYRREGLNISADVSAEQDFYAAFPLHYYPGYRILVDGVETEGYAMYSLLTCSLPEGVHHIDISWVTPRSFRVCDILSLCTAVLSFAWWFYKYRRR